MKTSNIKKILFGLLVIVQLAAPAWIIARHETILRQGTVYKFKTAPVDPYDAFRGRYVWLGIEQNFVPVDSDTLILSRNQTVYAHLAVDDEGFAYFSEASETIPTDKPCLRLPVSYHNYGDNKVVFEMPFNRFYMNERKAPRAEELYREHSRRDSVDAYVTVRVLDGQGVLEELYVGGVPILEALEE